MLKKFLEAKMKKFREMISLNIIQFNTTNHPLMTGQVINLSAKLKTSMV